MTSRRRLRAVIRIAVACVVLGVGLGAATGAVAASGAGPDQIVVTVPERGEPTSPPASGGAEITDAQLRWGLNAESGGGAYAGGCNFLSAGRAGDAGASRAWTEGDGFYRAQDGAVRIEKPTADGTWTRASWATRCLDPRGAAVTTARLDSASGNQVVIDGGTGALRDGALEIRWRGSFTVAFYGGMTYWSVTDPALTLDARGDGRLVGTASGYGTSMEDLSQWSPIEERTVVLAEIRGADVGGGSGFTVTPQYLGVEVGGVGQVARTSANAAHWGSFPASFVDFHRLTGQQGYWLTSGGARDAAKPATPLSVSYDAAAPVPTPAVVGAEPSSAAPANPLRPAPVGLPALAPTAGLPLVAAGTPLTTQPERAGLIPGLSGALSPLVAPLLASAAALSVAIVAVLSMMRALPWQRRGPTPSGRGRPASATMGV
jgi:hypothetical protein